MSGGNQKSTTTQSTSSSTRYPDYALPYAKTGLATSQDLATRDYAHYPYYYDTSGNLQNAENSFQSTVAPLNTMQTSALEDIYNYGMGDNTVVNNAMSNLSDTLSGKYLNADTNPYLADYAQNAMDDITRSYTNATVPQLSAAASRAGAFGGSADALQRAEYANNLANSLSKTATSIYEPAYEAERSNQVKSLALAPSTIQMPLTLSQAALGVGDVYQQQTQSEINDLVKQWQQAMEWPYYTSGTGTTGMSTYGWGSDTTGTGTSETKGSGSSASGLSSGLGGGLMGLASLVPFMSSFF